MNNLNLGIVFDNKFNVINHRSLLKVLLNPFLRILGKQIATDFDERNGFLRKIVLTNCPKQFKFYIKYPLNNNEFVVQKRRLF